MVVLVDGALDAVRRARRQARCSPGPTTSRLLEPAAHALADAARRGALGRITVERVDGEQLLGSGATPLRAALNAAGFVADPTRAAAAASGG